MPFDLGEQAFVYVVTPDALRRRLSRTKSATIDPA